MKRYSYYNNIYQEYINSKYVISLIPFENDYIFKKWGINSILMNNFMTFKYKLIRPSNLKSNDILMIGRASDKYKRFDIGFQAFEYITQYIPDCKLNIISSTDNTFFLQYLESNLNLVKIIDYIGYITKPEIYFKNASLHIFPSISEAFPMVLCETKIFGIPNILLGLDYLSISYGGTIIIYDDSPETLAKEAINLLKNYIYRKKLGKQARLSMKRFNNNLLLRKWVKLILSIYNGYNYYQNMINNDKKISNKTAIKFLKKELELLKKRKPIFSKMTINDILNFSYLKNLQ